MRPALPAIPPWLRSKISDALTGEWIIGCTTAKTRRKIHYWATIFWLTGGTAIWLMLKDSLMFVGFMSLYAIWWTHIAGWGSETPVEAEEG